jgi:hypothetical protein
LVSNRWRRDRGCSGGGCSSPCAWRPHSRALRNGLLNASIATALRLPAGEGASCSCGSGMYTLPCIRGMDVDSTQSNGNTVRVVFRYQTFGGNGSGTTKCIAVDSVCIKARGGPLRSDFSCTSTGPTDVPPSSNDRETKTASFKPALGLRAAVGARLEHGGRRVSARSRPIGKPICSALPTTRHQEPASQATAVSPSQ